MATPVYTVPLKVYTVDLSEDVNRRNFIGVTPPHVAVLNNTEATSLLFKYNADVNITTNLGYTPLQYPAKHSCYKACRLLCKL